MKPISEVKEKPSTSSLNICPGAVRAALGGSLDISFKDDVTVIICSLRCFLQ
jgi:hypothetical protein